MQSALDSQASLAAALSQGTPITGVVKAWYEDKGFGFLMPDGGGPDVFCHRNQLTDGTTPETGTQVTFEVRLNPSRGKYEATSCQGAGVLPAAKTALESLGVSIGVGANKQVSDNLFVAGLPTDFGEERVRALFTPYGIVKQVKVLPANGKPDTAALIRMADLEKAQWMVDNLNGTTPQGLPGPISVRYADNRAEKAKALSIVMGSPAPAVAGYGGIAGASLASSRFSPYDPYAGAAGMDSMLGLPAIDASLAAATAAALGAAQPAAQVPAPSADAGALSAAAVIAALAPALGQLGTVLGLQTQQTQQTQELQSLIQTLQSLQGSLAAAGLGALASSGAAAASTAPVANPQTAGLLNLGSVSTAGGLGSLGALALPAGSPASAPATSGVAGLAGLHPAGAVITPTAPTGTQAAAPVGQDLAALSSALALLPAMGGTTVAADAGLANLGPNSNLTSAGTTVAITNMAAGALAAPVTQVGALGGSPAALGDALAAALAGTGITLP